MWPTLIGPVGAAEALEVDELDELLPEPHPAAIAPTASSATSPMTIQSFFTMILAPSVLQLVQTV